VRDARSEGLRAFIKGVHPLPCHVPDSLIGIVRHLDEREDVLGDRRALVAAGHAAQDVRDRLPEAAAEEDEGMLQAARGLQTPHLEELVERAESTREDDDPERVLVQHELPRREVDELQRDVDGGVHRLLERETDVEALGQRLGASGHPACRRLGRGGTHIDMHLLEPAAEPLGHGGHDPGAGARAWRDACLREQLPHPFSGRVVRILRGHPGTPEESDRRGQRLEDCQPLLQFLDERLGQFRARWCVTGDGPPDSAR
jgi:hypothetical protein